MAGSAAATDGARATSPPVPVRDTSRTGTRPAVPVTSATCGVTLIRGPLRPGAGWRPGRSRGRGAGTPGPGTRTPTAGAIPTGREVTTRSGRAATAGTGPDVTTGGTTARPITVTKHGGTIPGEADLSHPRTTRARSCGGARTISGLCRSGLIRSGRGGRHVSRTRPRKPCGLPPDGTNSRNHPVIGAPAAAPEAHSTPPAPTPGARLRRRRAPRGARRLRRPPIRTVPGLGGTTPSGPQQAAARASPA